MSKYVAYLPPGDYYIGDPCHVFPSNEIGITQWMEILYQVDYFAEKYKSTIVVDGKEITIYAHNTIWGDGIYDDTYIVESGIIGIIRLEDVRVLTDLSDEYLMSVGKLVSVDEEFKVVFNTDDPTHKFGDLEIYTDTLNDEDDLLMDDEEDDY